MAPPTMNVTAVAKVVLHACKYPHSTVNGVLLASKNNVSEIVDAVPLFHSNIALLPMLEASLYQVESYSVAHNLVICGYYQVSDELQDHQPDIFAQKIADKISESCSATCLLVVCNDLIDRDCAENPLFCYHQQEGKWKECERPQLAEGALESTASLLHTKAYRTLVDFDNHLDDLRLDWLNKHISQKIAEMT